MSFILDALRKSEAARRRSEAPDLFAPMPAAAADARPRTAWPLWALGIGGALALLAAIALLVLRPTAPADPRTTAPAADTAPAETVPAAAGPAAGIPTAPPPMPGPTPGTVANIGPAPSPNQPLPERAPPAVPPSSPAAGQTAARPAATVAEANPRPDAAPDAPAAALADLDPAARKQLPPLKLSMHLWNETPERRLVILDGQRLKEGDVIGEAVIERITRDGVVLAWRGARLKLSAE